MAEEKKPIKTVPGGRVKIDDKTRRCLECNEPLIKKHIDNVLYYICPKGCGRWAPNEKILRAREKKAVSMVLLKHCSPEPITGGGAAKGKGSSKSGKKRKKPVKKKKPWEWD